MILKGNPETYGILKIQNGHNGNEKQNGYEIVSVLQWGKKVFSQPPIVQVLPLKKMREACNFHHRYTSTMTDKIREFLALTGL